MPEQGLLQDFHYGRRDAVELWNVIAKAYARRMEIEPLLSSLGVEPSAVYWDTSAREVWYPVLRSLWEANKLQRLLDKVLADESKSTFHARIQELVRPAPSVEAPVGGSADPRTEATPEEREVMLGPSPTFVEIGVLEGALTVASAVARLEIKCLAASYHGSAFLVAADGADLLVTNHHVLFDWEQKEQRADSVVAWFSYETGADGQPKRVLTARGDPATIVGSRPHDWAAIRLLERVPDSYRRLSLAPPRAPAEGEDVYVIQHPNGLTKRIALTRNQLRKVEADRIQYLTDTEQGSSGSPVFNGRWEVLAVHHRHVTVFEPEGKVAYRNQGIRIDRVREGLVAAGVTLV